MNVSNFSTKQKYQITESIINITSWMGSQIANLCNAVSIPITATRDALAERLQSLRETVSSLYNRMMDDTEYGRERLKEIVRKKARKKRNKLGNKKKKNRQKATSI